MGRLNLSEMAKEATILATTGVIGIDGLLASAEIFGLVDIPAKWYVGLPLAGVSAIFLGAALRTGDKIWDKVEVKRIAAFREVGPRPELRSIPIFKNGRGASILASTMPTIFGEAPATLSEPEHKIFWRIPWDDETYVVKELELSAFLELSTQRKKHQFSRRYWCERRRPAMPRQRYEAIMKLLYESGLVEGRGSRSSGHLRTTPRHAVTYLKHTSRYAV